MPKRKQFKLIPRFESEADERAFWETHDTADYVDWSRARVAVFPNLKPSTETISLRLPASLLAELKVLANRRDVPYQSLLKVFLAERISHELAREARVRANHGLDLPARPVTGRAKSAARPAPVRPAGQRER
ncbi:MAG: BrnA antitoxin family protein [candidate division NC10 bacterium]|nr:BrnA antitoxin family protein [candidate division NC10 bacterium]